MRVAVNSHALPVYTKNRIASLLCIFETIILHVRMAVNSHALPVNKKNRITSLLCIFETIIALKLCKHLFHLDL